MGTAFVLSSPLLVKRGRQPELGQRICHCAPRMRTGEYTAVSIVPTGIGANIGGYAGDALPSARLLSSVADCLITHPNVLNGALMYWPIRNALYVEGYTLDRFAHGDCALMKPGHGSNRIGLIIDSAMDEDSITRHLQVADAARGTLGLRVSDYTVTDMPLGVSLLTGANGASWGGLSNPGALLRAAKKLVDSGCDAIAIVARFPDDEDQQQLADYRSGSGVDAIAGAEAVISHLVSREFGVPCAHAPALEPLDVDQSVSPKAAAEELGYTFLSCVLVGLSRAPQIISLQRHARTTSSAITATDVNAVIVPEHCFGGAAVMSLAALPNVLVISVIDNATVMNVPHEAVGIPGCKVYKAASYAEATGLMAAHKSGIDLHAITSQVPHIRLCT